MNAQAEIQGNTVIVSAPGVDQPEAVRFGWANYPVVNLWNREGLPGDAVPHRRLAGCHAAKIIKR